MEKTVQSVVDHLVKSRKPVSFSKNLHSDIMYEFEKSYSATIIWMRFGSTIHAKRSSTIKKLK